MDRSESAAWFALYLVCTLVNMKSPYDIYILCNQTHIGIKDVHNRRIHIEKGCHNSSLTVDNIIFSGNQSSYYFGGISIYQFVIHNSICENIHYKVIMSNSRYLNLSWNDIYSTALHHHLNMPYAAVYVDVKGGIDILIQNTSFI